MIQAMHTASERHQVYPLVEIQGVKVRVPHPARVASAPLVEREDLLVQALAAWLAEDGIPPLNFRLVGPPGVGKNTLVYQLAAGLEQDLYILNGHEELDPEDIACSARLTSADTVEYVASPLFAAMLRGGIFFFDEIGKAPAAALNPLASVLDERRTLTSVLAGIHLSAHPDFRFCAALNEDEESNGRLPPFLAERLTPAIRVDPPDTATLQAILQSHLASVDTRWIRIYLEEHWAEDLSPRRAIRALQYAWKLARQTGQAAVADDEIRACLCQPSRTREAMAGNAAPGHRNGKRNEQPPQGGTNAGKLVLPFLGKDPSKRMH